MLMAHRHFKSEAKEGMEEFVEFQKQRESWLHPYTLFRLLIREYEGNTNWGEWRPEHQSYPSAQRWLARHPNRHGYEELRDGYAFIQWIAWRQWTQVKAYAASKNVLLMGEISFGVSRCSADVWQHPELFDHEWFVGSQPINFFDTNKDSERWGQNWGLPAYRWENHRSTQFSWLKNRFEGARQFFHMCRIDHLRGYFRAYMFPWPGGPRHTEFSKLTEEAARQKTEGKLPRFVPAADDDPVGSKMNDLQGRELIQIMQQSAQEMYLIAEIMGELPVYMQKALDDLKLANLTFPQLERNSDRSLHPLHSFRKLSLVTYANHDHAPLAAYYLHLHEKAKANPNGESAKDLEQLLKFAQWTKPAPENLSDELLEALVRRLFQAPCQLAVLMSSDLFGILQRFNLPGSYGAETWSERLEFPLPEYSKHLVYKERIATAQRMIGESDRKPLTSLPAS